MVSYYDDLLSISYRISEQEINSSKIIIVIHISLGKSAVGIRPPLFNQLINDYEIDLMNVMVFYLEYRHLTTKVFPKTFPSC